METEVLQADIQSALERELGVPVGVVMQVPFTNGPSFTFYPSFDDKIVTALESLEKKYPELGTNYYFEAFGRNRARI